MKLLLDTQVLLYELLFSAASLCEIAIKRALGLCEGITLVTADSRLAKYDGPIRRV